QSLTVDLVYQAWSANGEGQPALHSHNWSQCDVCQGAVQEVPLIRPKGSGVDRIGYEDVGHVKHGNSSIGTQTARPEPVLETGEVDGIIDGLAPGVVDLELQVVAVAFGQGGGQSVIDRAADGLVAGVL